MSALALALHHGKNADNQLFSLARLENPTTDHLATNSLGPGVTNQRRDQLHADPTFVFQFACPWDNIGGMLTHPTIITLPDGTDVVIGNFSDTLGEPVSVHLLLWPLKVSLPLWSIRAMLMPWA